MNASAETSFADLLAAASTYILPTTDALVMDALNTYGASFSKAKKAPKPAERYDLLAGLVWLHATYESLDSTLANASENQQRLLATALDLDYDLYSALPTWPKLIGRRIMAQMAPGSTPQKRVAAQPEASGQIVKHGSLPAADHGPALADAARAPSSKRRRPAAPVPPPLSSDSDGYEILDNDPAGGASGRGIAAAPTGPPLQLLPAEFGYSVAFRALVTARLARPWVSVAMIEAAAPPHYRNGIYLGASHTQRARRDYDLMLKTGPQREDPHLVACPHRLSFAFSGDRNLALDGRNLALLCTAERATDFSNPQMAGVAGGARDRADFLALLSDVRTSWDDARNCILLERSIGLPTLTNITSGVSLLMERRYFRFAQVLAAGDAREEILAHTARQGAEFRAYALDLNADLVGRGAALPYERQAIFVGERYFNFLQPAMSAFLDTDVGPVPGGLSLDSIVAAPAGPAARRCLLSSAPGATGAPVPSLPPSPAAAHLVAATPYGQWPYFPPALGSPPPPGSHAAWHVAPALPTPPPAYATPPPTTPQPAPAPAGAPGPTPGPTAPPPAGGGRQAHTALTGKALWRKANKIAFCGQPQHCWTSGTDCASVPPGEVRNPACRCSGSAAGSGSTPHAIWDCPLRYIAVFGKCPGFRIDGSRDPAQWNGSCLTRAAKTAWQQLITFEEIPAPSGAGFAPTPFHL